MYVICVVYCMTCITKQSFEVRKSGILVNGAKNTTHVGMGLPLHLHVRCITDNKKQILIIDKGKKMFLLHHQSMPLLRNDYCFSH